jgi:hypothetical protein
MIERARLHYVLPPRGGRVGFVDRHRSARECTRGTAYDEVAREEELTPERVRQIVREALERRIVDDETDSREIAIGEARALGGRRKPLKRLDSAKEIQGFPWLKLLNSGPIWLNLDLPCAPEGAAG